MKLVLIILTIVTITSCNSQNINDQITTYNNWKKSFVNSVTNEKNLLDFQKKNLLDISKNISSNDFIKLRKVLTDMNNDTIINNEYYLLEFSEGEVITAYLYYITKSDKKYQLAFLNINEETKEVGILNKSDSEIKKLINLKPIENDSLNDELFVLTTINKKEMFSILGNKE